jgi:DNA-directed RNA polymerase subunit beta'
LDERIPAYDSVFATPEEAIMAYQLGHIRLRQLITVRINEKILETTVGRVMFNEALPEAIGYINENANSGVIQQIVNKAFSTIDHKRVIQMIDAIKNLGFS